MRIIFSENAWEDYLSWHQGDKKNLKKINELLIKSIARTPFERIGKPEPLKFDLAGSLSRRIDNEHRINYQIVGKDLFIIGCRYHYDR